MILKSRHFFHNHVRSFYDTLCSIKFKRKGNWEKNMILSRVNLIKRIAEKKLKWQKLDLSVNFFHWSNEDMMNNWQTNFWLSQRIGAMSCLPSSSSALPRSSLILWLINSFRPRFWGISTGLSSRKAAAFFTVSKARVRETYQIKNDHHWHVKN